MKTAVTELLDYLGEADIELEDRVKNRYLNKEMLQIKLAYINGFTKPPIGDDMWHHIAQEGEKYYKNNYEDVKAK
jgi:hypothetical protein